MVAALAATVALSTGPAFAQAAPTGSVTFDGYEPAGAVPTGLHVRIGVGDPGSGPPLLRRLDLDLPVGFDLGAQAFSRSGGLSLCTTAQFAAIGAPRSTCPAASRIGSAQIIAPSVGELRGDIYLGTPQSAGALPTLNVEVSESGLSAPDATRAKLVGTLTADGAGRVRAVFDQIPNLAFSQLDLTLDPGTTAILITPGACGAAAGLVTLTAASDGATGTATGATTIGPDCASTTFAPRFELSSDTREAGLESTMRATVTVPDRGPALTEASLQLPSGLLAHIGDVPECGTDAVAAGQCSVDSRIGFLNATVGAGPAPITLTGPVFIVPRSGGGVAGIAAAVDVRLGDLDLGRLTIPGQFFLRPTDAGLDLRVSTPTSFGGIALHVRSLYLVVDRAGFALNPSTCGPLSYGGTVGGTGGATALVGGAITYDGCTARAFAPTLTAALGGETGPLGHPNVSVALNARQRDSNLSGATVTLPRGVAADPANLRNACPERLFQASACSAAARVGTTTARVALTPEPIPGDVYLVKIDGQQLPGLGLSFTGRYTQRVLSTVQVGADSRLVVRFDAIPDLPLRRLDLTVTGGSQGPIRIAGGKCLDGSVWDASFRGQGGQVSSHTIPAPCPAHAAKRAAVTLSSSRGLSVRLSDLGGRNLHSLKVTLPGGFSLNRVRAADRRFRALALDGGNKATVKTTNRTVQVFPQSNATTRISLKLGPGTVTRSPSLKAGSHSVLVDVRVAFTDGSVQRQKIRLRAS